MFRKIKEFHIKTMEAYRADIADHLEPWKQKVMEIHENAGFLFYAELLEMRNNTGSCVISGDLVKGKISVGDQLLILNGEGEAVAEAVLRSSPSEKEEERKGLIHHKRHIFQADLTSIKGEAVCDMDTMTLSRRLRSLEMEMSLIIEG